MPTRLQAFIARLVALFRRNPGARADALELAATSARQRADGIEHLQPRRAERLRRRAELFEQRARQLRRRA